MSTTHSDCEPRSRAAISRPIGRVFGRTIVAAAVVALVACSSSNGADSSATTPRATTPTTTPSEATTPANATTPASDEALAPGDYEVAAFVVPLSYTIVDDGWSRLMSQRRIVLLQRGDLRVAISAAQLAAETPQGVVDKVCPGDIQLGDPSDAELLGESAVRTDGLVVNDCTFVLDTKGDSNSGRWLVKAGSNITIITTQVDDEFITVIADVPASPADITEIDRLLASLQPS